MKKVSAKRPGRNRSLEIIRPLRGLTTTMALLALPCLYPHSPLFAEGPPSVRENINWPEFMARQDMVWERLSEKWGDGAFIGNGHLGAMIFKQDKNTLKWEIGHNQITLPVGGAGEAGEILMGLRIPIGDFLLVPAGEIESESMRMDLWNAETRGEFKTGKGEVKWRTFAHAKKMLIAVEIEATGEEAEALKFDWRPDKLGTRSYYGQPAAENPEVSMETLGDIRVCVQRYNVGWLHAVAWSETRVSPGRRVIFISVGRSCPGEETRDAAIREVKEAMDLGLGAAQENHRQWWHEFWPAGAFLSFSDPYWENFYWLQMYKLASATRADSVVLDLCGPWLNHTGWPYTAWNLNVQLTYWPLCAANRMEIGESLYANMDKYFDNLVLNVPPHIRGDSAAIGWSSSYDFRSNVNPSPDGKGPPWTQTMGDLPWLCHNYWLHYRHSMDDERLKTKLFPLLKRSVNFYLHYLREKNDRLNLIPTHSPEYATALNCNYDLALLRWGCETLIRICDRLKIEDPMLETWQETLDRLAPYPVDETGFMIGEGVPLTGGHRHYSHLMMIYPLYLVTRDNPQEKELAEKSLNHWMVALPGGKTGFSYTGAASISAALGKGDDALKHLNGLPPFLKTNTMYTEGTDYPCMETPPSAAQAIHDMLIQSWGDRIRIFPATPAAWEDVVMHNVRAEGAFLVSARREKGKTVFVRIRSLAGEPCRMETDLPAPVKIAGDAKIISNNGNVLELDLKRGDEAILYSGDAPTELIVNPVPAQPESRNTFGLMK